MFPYEYHGLKMCVLIIAGQGMIEDLYFKGFNVHVNTVYLFRWVIITAFQDCLLPSEVMISNSCTRSSCSKGKRATKIKDRVN